MEFQTCGLLLIWGHILVANKIRLLMFSLKMDLNLWQLCAKEQARM